MIAMNKNSILGTISSADLLNKEISVLNGAESAFFISVEDYLCMKMKYPISLDQQTSILQ